MSKEMKALVTRTMVKILYRGACTVVENLSGKDSSREIEEESLVSLASYLDLVGLSLAKDSIPSMKSLVEYWRMYSPGVDPLVPSHKTPIERVFGSEEKCARHALQLTKMLWSESEDFTERVSELCELLTIDLTSEEKERLTEKHIVLGLSNRLIKEYKYTVNLVFSKFFQTEPPKKPYNEVLGLKLFPRRLVVAVRRIIGRKSSQKRLKMRDCQVIYTIFQGLKKGLLPIRPDALDQSLVDHMTALTKNAEVEQTTLDRLEALLKEEFPGLPKYVGKRFAGRERDDNGRLSTKSTVEMTMIGEGQVGFARRLFNTPDSQWKKIESSNGGVLEELNDFWNGTDTAPARPIFHEIPELIGFGCNRERGFYPLYADCQVTDKEVFHILTEYREFCVSRGDEMNCVRPAAILEPMKGRIITKPSVGSYLNMICLQKAMWSYLQRYRTFCCTGRPVEDDDIRWVAECFEMGMSWNSGDYSGATDNLKGSLSKMILRYILTDVGQADPALYQQCIQSFTAATIKYDQVPCQMTTGFGPYYREHWKCTNMGDVVQTNGQLMGHVLSFPVLCIANYLIFKLAYQDMGISAPRCLVNGDDILFCCTEEVFEHWKLRVAECGFFPSVGKNLFSPNVAQINSVLFRIKYEMESEYSLETLFSDMRVSPIRSIERVQYLNFGLLTSRGKGRLGGTDTVKTSTCAQFTSNESLDMNEGFARLPVLSEIWRDLNCCGSTFDQGVLRSLFKKHHLECFGVLRDNKVPFFSTSALPHSAYALCGKLNHYSMSNGFSDFRDSASVCSGMKKVTTDVEIVRNLKRVVLQFRRFPFGYMENPFDIDGFDLEEERTKTECTV